MQKEKIVARGEVKVLLDYLARTPYGLTRDWIAVPVTILTETERAHTLRFEQADLDKYVERCAEKKVSAKELPTEIAKEDRDYKVDYSEFSDKISDAHFPRGGAWLMMGPTGPRRLRLAIEHLANFRGSSCYFIDLDPRWVKKVISNKQFEVARAYMDHVVDQAVTILKNRKVTGLFTTPKLLEALGEKVNLFEAGIRGVFCGGTSMPPQQVRFLVEEVLEHKIGFYPTYGNTLMGLAASVPLQPEDNFSVTYYAPQPRAILRVVKPSATRKSPQAMKSVKVFFLFESRPASCHFLPSSPLPRMWAVAMTKPRSTRLNALRSNRSGLEIP